MKVIPVDEVLEHKKGKHYTFAILLREGRVHFWSNWSHSGKLTYMKTAPSKYFEHKNMYTNYDIIYRRKERMLNINPENYNEEPIDGIE